MNRPPPDCRLPMVEIMHTIARTFLASTLCILLFCGCTNKEDNKKPLSGRAPNFALEAVNGGTLRLEDLRGKVVLLNFFATWCLPCRQEIPDFVRLYENFKHKGFEIVGIGLDMEGAAVLRPFLRHFRVSYPVLLGTREVVVDYGGIRGIPTTFLIDKNGIIAERFVGLRPPRVLEQSVLELLEGKG